VPEPATKLTRAEAARRNGARSCGPTTPEGNARSSQNALKHGLTAQAFTLLPGQQLGEGGGILAGQQGEGLGGEAVLKGILG
jgi:hypothetical protein